MLLGSAYVCLKHPISLLMYPVRVLSLNKGWDILIENKPEEWGSIKRTLAVITDEIITQPSSYLDKEAALAEEAALLEKAALVGKVARTDNETPEEEEILEEELVGNIDAEKDNAYSLQYVYIAIARKDDWNSSELYKKIKSSLSIAAGQIKNEVLLYFLSNQFTASQLNEIIYVMSPRAIALGEAAVTVVLVPDESTQHLFKTVIDRDGSTGVGAPFLESECRVQLKELSPIKNSAPMAFVFCSLEESELVVEELPTDGVPFVDRALVFPPEYYQAG